MPFMSRLDRHEKLMSRMGDRNSADLSLALQSGVVDPEDYRRAVFSCTACSNPEGCEARLEAGEPGVPEFCRNGDLMARVADRLGGMVTPEPG